ncbi:hypothetical protein [Alicyclobacillus sendaiensis]|uniref:hypothetical protein n=1 Tax=Alicyclobacillus sendaiensis TaxID=192387 RepID=UPI0026F414CE|nr:hypothetical protein [Alicyclobacillus sendaiensis]
MAGPQTSAPVYTGNNVYIEINDQIVGLVETLTITRNVNRRPVYQVGTPLFNDAPVTQASVQVTATNMAPLQGRSNSAPSLASQGIIPSASLAEEINNGPYDIKIIDSNTGDVVWYVVNAYYNQDAVQVPSTDIVTYNLSWIAQDSMAWT